MKLVQYAIAACAVVTVAACGADNSGSGSATKCDDVDGTFALIQQQIFENRGCTASACHGESATAGLDLTPDNAYASLINVEANSGDYVRVFPGEQDLSLLYQKVAAKTEGFELGSLPSPISGGAMPTGPDVLSDDDLGLLRVWIRGGAPERGVVDGSQKYAACDVQGEIAPNKIQPLPAPAADEGVQLYSGGWDVPPEAEGEVCFVTYYDFSEQVPEEYKVPCDEAQGGPERECFAYNNIVLAQDPQSHHSIVDVYIPSPKNSGHWDPMNEDHWQGWSCLGGANAGASCTPGADECGDRGQCTTPVQTTVACIGYKYGPPEMGTIAGLFGAADVKQNLATAQESSFREDYPPAVFSKMPVKGFVLWDNHAFNLTQQETSVEQWMNLEFAPPEEQVFPRVQIFDGRNLLDMGRIDAYTSKEVCTSYTLPQHAQLLTLTSHTHRFGKHFRIWYPPNEVCFAENNDPNCVPPDREPDSKESRSWASIARTRQTVPSATARSGTMGSPIPRRFAETRFDPKRRPATSWPRSRCSPTPLTSSCSAVAAQKRSALALADPTRGWRATATTRYAAKAVSAMPAQASPRKRKCSWCSARISSKHLKCNSTVN